MSHMKHKFSCKLLILFIYFAMPFDMQAQDFFDFFHHSHFRPTQQQLPGRQFIFSNNPSNQATSLTTTQPPFQVYVNNQPIIVPPITFMAPTTPSPQFLSCFGNCLTTSEYNPVCANNRQLYQNEQKFNCARGCGANIQIVRRGSCAGLFPITRG